MAKSRPYSCSDEKMLMTCRIIAESFNTNLSELSTLRTDWTEEFATALIARIDKALDEFLGKDVKMDLRKATTNLQNIQVTALRDLSFFKTQIDDDFKNEPSRRTEILKSLGFTAYLKLVQNKKQEPLIQLLHTFKTNITEELRTEITSKGISPILIDRIMADASTFQQANLRQETLKGTKKEITQEMLDEYLGIYDVIIGICKKASNYYRYEPLKRDLFTFSKVLRNLGTARKISENTDMDQVA
jgi:hypothetical protein